jgi:demethylmenaquinone methyltransferase / 2-methoxy-6-polyprenyl-1,4-benzoquinol methylase
MSAVGSDADCGSRIQAMFSAIAKRYDFANTVLSFGIDRLWRKKLIAEINPAPNLRILDLCTGTADLVHLSQALGVEVVGVDFSQAMLLAGRRKYEKNGEQINLIQADALRLPFKHDLCDYVMIAFGVRNLNSLQNGLREISRVLKKEGRLLVLEFGRPPRKIWGQCYSLYLSYILPQLGGLLTGERAAYRYLETTINAFPCGRDFAAVLEQCGYKTLKVQPLSGGIAYLYVAQKLTASGVEPGCAANR